LPPPIDSISVRVYATQADAAREAARAAATCLRPGGAAVFATGNSQLQFLRELKAQPDLDWSSLVLFHLDEFLGIDPEHPASFRRYLRDRLERPAHPGAFHYLHGNSDDPIAECDRYQGLLARHPVQLCCLGIGHNGHLAFNEPAVARIDDPRAVKIVRLSETTREAQRGNFPEGGVPHYAMTMTLPAIFAARQLLCLAFGASKAEIVARALTGEIAIDCPASFLRQHPQVWLYLDADAARQLPDGLAGTMTAPPETAI